MDTVVRARGLTKTYRGHAAVRDLDLDVTAGSIVGVVGPSGSGKTTTVRMLLGAEMPTEGEITVFGKHPWEFSPTERARIGYMPQLSVLYPHLSLQENLRFVASVYGLPLRGRARLREVLEFVELADHRRKLLRETSGGMQRRLALAAALLHEPDLLFLDEPTAGIGPIQRRKFWDHFRALQDRGRTLVITTQYVGEAVYCDLVIVLAEGRRIAADTPDALRRLAFGGDVVTAEVREALRAADVGELRSLPMVREASVQGGDGRRLRIVVEQADVALARLQAWFSERDVQLESISQEHPAFDEVFVQLVEQTAHA